MVHIQRCVDDLLSKSKPRALLPGFRGCFEEGLLRSLFGTGRPEQDFLFNQRTLVIVP